MASLPTGSFVDSTYTTSSHLDQDPSRTHPTQGPSCGQPVLLRASSRSFVRAVPWPRTVRSEELLAVILLLAMCAAYARYQARVSKKDGNQRLLRCSFMHKFTRAQSRDWHFAGKIPPTTHEATTWAILVRHDTRRRWKPLSSFGSRKHCGRYYSSYDLLWRQSPCVGICSQPRWRRRTGHIYRSHLNQEKSHGPAGGSGKHARERWAR